jgi:hypothetical protein
MFLVGEEESLRKSVVNQEMKSNLYLKVYYMFKNNINKLYYFKTFYITDLTTQKRTKISTIYQCSD